MSPFDERCISRKIPLKILIDKTRRSPMSCFVSDYTVILSVMITDTFDVVDFNACDF